MAIVCSPGSDVGPAHGPSRVPSALDQPPSGWGSFTALEGEAGNSREPPSPGQAALSSWSTEDLGYLAWLHLGRGQLVHTCPSEKATVAKSRANKETL